MGERRDALKHMACASQPGPEVSTPRDGAKAAERPVLLSVQLLFMGHTLAVTRHS